MPLQVNREVFITCPVTDMGARVIGPEEVREKLKLQKRSPV